MTRPPRHPLRAALRLPQPPTHGSHPRPAPTASGTLSGARRALGAKISRGGPSQTHNPVLRPVGLRRDAGPREHRRGSGWAVRRTSLPHFPMPTPLQARPAKKYMHRKKEQRAASAVRVLGEGSCEQRPRRLARSREAAGPRRSALKRSLGARRRARLLPLQVCLCRLVCPIYGRPRPWGPQSSGSHM